MEISPPTQITPAEEAARKARAARFNVPYIPRQSNASTTAPTSSLLTTIEEDAKREIERRLARAKRFGVPTRLPLNKDDGKIAGVSGEEGVVEILEARREVGIGEVIREEALNCWPMDMLSTGEVVEYWEGFDVAVEWLNDSNCNIKFRGREARDEAVRVVCGGWPRVGGWGEEGRGEMEVVNGEKDVGDSVGKKELVDTESEEFKKSRVWAQWMLGREGKMGMRLWVRAATDADRRPKKPNPNSKWSRTVRDKKVEQTIGGGERSLLTRLGAPLGSKGVDRSKLSSVPVTIRKQTRGKQKTKLNIDAAAAELYRLDATPGVEK